MPSMGGTAGREPVAYGAAAAVAGEQVARLEPPAPLRRVDLELDLVRLLRERCQPMPVEDLPAPGLRQAIVQNQ